MVQVKGHWRALGWVQGHLRRPHRHGERQLGLVLLVDPPVRLDPHATPPGGVAASCPLAERPGAVPDGSRPLADRLPRPRLPVSRRPRQPT